MKLINQIHKMNTKDLNMSNIVNKNIVLQHKFKNVKNDKYNKNNTI